MTTIFDGIIYTFGSASGLKATVSYDYKRDGADMLYQFYYKIDLVNRNTGQHNPYGTYQNPLKAIFTLNGNDVWEKTTQGNQGWVYEFTSDWITVKNKTSNTTPFSFTIKDTINTSWCNYSSSAYYLEVSPAGSEINNVPNFTIGTNFVVSLTKYNSNFYDVLTIKIGSTTIKTINGATSSQTVSFTSSELNSIYNATLTTQQPTFTFNLSTYTDSNKGTLVGNAIPKTAIGSYSNPNPTISSKSSSATNTQSLTGSASKIVLNASNVTITINFSLKYNATLKKVTIGGKTATISGSSASVTIDKPNTNSFSISAEDSRQYKVNDTYTITNYVVYVPLTFVPTVARNEPTDGKVNISYNDSYFAGSFGSTDNTLTVEYRSRCISDNESFAEDGSDWVSLSPTITTSTNKYSQNITLENYNYQKSYEFELRAKDKLNTIYLKNVQIGIGIPVWDFGENDFNVNGEIKKNGNPIFETTESSQNYDLNTLTQSGIYYTNAYATNAPENWLKVLVMGGYKNTTDAMDVAQFAISIGGKDMWYRVRNTRTWSDWFKIQKEKNTFPVGSIYLSVNSTNPTNYYGGTWVLIGQGRTIVGVDTSQTEFNAPEKTGGEKISTQIATGSSQYGFTPSSPSGYNDRTLVSVKSFGIPHDEQNANISLVQPYITCYIWKRTE